jgi:hypothetical protein
VGAAQREARLRIVVHYRGSPVYQAESLVDAYIWVREAFKARWPLAIYGTQEAAAHGFTVVGTPELTKHVRRELKHNTD